MVQHAHRLVGVVEVSEVWDFEAIPAELDEAAALPEVSVLADTSQLAGELQREYEQLTDESRSCEMALL